MFLLPAPHSPRLVAGYLYLCKDCLWTVYTSFQLIYAKLFSSIEIQPQAMNLCKLERPASLGTNFTLSYFCKRSTHSCKYAESDFIADMELGVSCLDRCNCLDQTARAYLLLIQQGKSMSLFCPLNVIYCPGKANRENNAFLMLKI